MEESKEIPGAESQEMSDEAAKETMSNLNPEKGFTPEMIEEFKTRVREMNQIAKDVTQGLGLPPEAQGTVLRSLFGRGSRTQNPGGQTPGPT